MSQRAGGYRWLRTPGGSRGDFKDCLSVWNSLLEAFLSYASKPAFVSWPRTLPEPDVSILVPFWGLPFGILNIKVWLNPKKEQQWRL